MLKKFKFSWVEGIGMHTMVLVYYMQIYNMLKKFKFSWVDGICMHTMVSVYYTQDMICWRSLNSLE